MRALVKPIAIAVLMSGSALAQGWIEYAHLTDRFSVNFPTEPEVSETTYLSAHGVVFPARVYAAQSGRSSYSLTVVDYTQAEQRHAERPDQTDASSGSAFWVMDVRASVAHAANSFRSRGGEVTYEGWVDIDKVEGHQLQITNPDQSRSFVAIHLNDSRLYILEGTVPHGYPAPGMFQQSLVFLNEDGERIRYTLDPNGQRTDVRTFDLDEQQASGVRRIVVD